MNDIALNKNYLTSIYSIAERGMIEFNMPLTNEGKFEVLMYGIWLGLRTLDKYGIPINHKESLSEVKNYLVKYASNLDIPSDKNAEKLFTLRDEEWERDTKLLVPSSFPLSNHILLEYLYLCFIDSPLVMFSSIELSKKVDQIDKSSLANFLMVFETYYNDIKSRLKEFESDSQSYKSRANEIANQDLSEEKNGLYSELEKKLILRIQNGGEKQHKSLEDLMPLSADLAIIDQIVAKTAFSMDFLNLHPSTDVKDSYMLLIKELSEKDLDKLNAEKNELVYVIKPMYEQGLETRKRCAAMIMALDDESEDERIKVINAGESLLSSIIKRIDSYIKTLDWVIELKSRKNSAEGNNNRNISKSNSGCLSLFSFIFLIIGSCVFFLIK